jgi:hypothetical protein
MAPNIARRAFFYIDDNDLAFGSRRTGVTRSRRRSRHGRALHPTGDGHPGLWNLSAGGRQRADWRAAKALRAADLTATPIAVHAGYDHRAAWPVFLHISRVALPDRIPAGEIPGINAIGFRLIPRINANALGRPPDRRLRGRLIRDRRRCLRNPRARRGLRLRTRREQ